MLEGLATEIVYKLPIAKDEIKESSWEIIHNHLEKVVEISIKESLKAANDAVHWGESVDVPALKITIEKKLK